MQTDRYIRIVLTIIATALVWLCLRDTAPPAFAQASRDLEAQTAPEIDALLSSLATVRQDPAGNGAQPTAGRVFVPTFPNGSETVDPESQWDIVYASPYAEGLWFAVKHNRMTGETLVLDSRGGSNDDQWRLLPISR